MRVRYTKDNSGKLVKCAEIYTQEDHHISKDTIDSNAVSIINRLEKKGFTAYIVGGAVRDLLLGTEPKDFDIVTDATPRQIRRSFRNSRIIGRRFKLVHIVFQNNIYEVSTFRSFESEYHSHNFGTPEEDVLRRDFSMNALFYSPTDNTILDFVGGVRDIKKNKIRPLISLKKIFTEDPVRMVRAIKYSAGTPLKLSFRLKSKLRSSVELLQSVSSSRLTEEFMKIIFSGKSEEIFRSLKNHNLLEHFMPNLHEYLLHNKSLQDTFFYSCQRCDQYIKSNSDPVRAQVYYLFFDTYMEKKEKETEGPVTHKDLLKELKYLIKPLTPPNQSLIDAIHLFKGTKKGKRTKRKIKGRSKPKNR
ncbi:MAG: polynucleotide adenylyltransferase PcnB [Spirochaetia bacterium]